MLEALSEYIDVANVGDADSIYEQVSRLTTARFRDLALTLWEVLPAPGGNESDFRFIGNSQLSGLPFPCIGYGCRAGHISELAHFAAVYADEVVLFNPFQRFALRDYTGLRKVHDFLVQDLSFTIASALLVRPLVDRGIITFVDQSQQSPAKIASAK